LQEALAAQSQSGQTKPEAVSQQLQATRDKAGAENAISTAQISSSRSSGSSSSTCCHAEGSLMAVAAALLSVVAVWLPLQ
jgi:cobalamin biosynthesis Mg chelatase CobN